MKEPCKTKNLQVKLEAVSPVGESIKSNEFVMDVIDDSECMVVDRLFLHVGECLYRIDNKGFIIEKIIPHE